MPVVILRAPLKDLAGGNHELRLDGTAVWVDPSGQPTTSPLVPTPSPFSRLAEREGPV